MQSGTPESDPIEESSPVYEEDRWAARNLTVTRLIAGGGILAAGLTAGLLVLFLVILDDDDGVSGGQVQAPVVRDNLIDAISSDGSIVLPERTALSFGTAGTLAELLVEAGDAVEEGDVIARLDDLTITGLKTSVEEARIALAEAEERLTQAQNPAPDLDLVSEEAAVVSAEQAVRDAEDRLEEARSPATELDLANMEAAVVIAERAVRDAEDGLEEARSSATELDLASAGAAVVSAEQAVRDAEDRLSELLSPSVGELLNTASIITTAEAKLEATNDALTDLQALPDQEAVNDAAAALQLARESLDNALTEQAVEKTARAITVADAAKAVDTMETNYVTAFGSWLGYDLSSEQIGQEPSAILHDAGIDLGLLFNPAAAGIPFTAVIDDPSTPWDEVMLFAWNWLSPQLIDGICGADGPRHGYRCVEDELQSSWDSLTGAINSEADTLARAAVALTAAHKTRDSMQSSLDTALDTLDAAQEPASTLDLRQARDAVLLAESELASAGEALDDLQSPDPDAVTVAQSDLEIARARVVDAQASSAELTAVGTDQQFIDLRQADLEVARAGIIDAKASLAEVQTVGTDQQLIDLRQAELKVAGALLVDATASLAEVRAVGTDQQLIDLREVEVASAQAVLSETEATQVEATIRAPVTGMVDVVNFEVGDELQRNSVVLEILDPTIVTLLMDVDQVDILSIAVGAEASVSIDALPGQQLVGTVSDIGPAAIAGAGSVTFPVTVTVEVPQGAQLLEGLSATAQVITSARADVLLVPAAAIGGSFTSPSVEVLRGGRLETVPVTLDGGNETFAIIASGVSEGDIVSFSLPDINEEANPFAVFSAGFRGGGFGGGGRGNFSIQAVPGGGQRDGR